MSFLREENIYLTVYLTSAFSPFSGDFLYIERMFFLIYLRGRCNNKSFKTAIILKKIKRPCITWSFLTYLFFLHLSVHEEQFPEQPPLQEHPPLCLIICLTAKYRPIITAATRIQSNKLIITFLI